MRDPAVSLHSQPVQGPAMPLATCFLTWYGQGPAVNVASTSVHGPAAHVLARVVRGPAVALYPRFLVRLCSAHSPSFNARLAVTLPSR